ncbi:hypothetical protein ACWGDE_38455, partial [Streptomyces sp. NPDC054956]
MDAWLEEARRDRTGTAFGAARGAVFDAVRRDGEGGPAARRLASLVTDVRDDVRLCVVRLLTDLASVASGRTGAADTGRLLLSDPDGRVRRAAAWLLAEADRARAEELLTAPADGPDAPDPVARLALAEALLVAGGDGLADRLRTDPDPAVRLRATPAPEGDEVLADLDAFGARIGGPGGRVEWRIGTVWGLNARRSDAEASCYAQVAALAARPTAAARLAAVDMAGVAMRNWRAAPAALVPHLRPLLTDPSAGPAAAHVLGASLEATRLCREELAQQVPARGETASPDGTPATGGTATPDRAPASDGAALPDGTPVRGETAIPGGTPIQGEASTPGGSPVRCETATPGGPPAQGGAATPGRTPARSETATLALARIGDVRALPELCRMVRAGRRGRGTGEAVRGLAGVPGVDLAPLVEAAVVALGRSGADEEGPALVVLSACGAAAAPAVPVLVRLLAGLPEDGSFDRRASRLVGALGAVGPAAAPALPLIDALAAKGHGSRSGQTPMALIRISGDRRRADEILAGLDGRPRGIRTAALLLDWLADNGGLEPHHVARLRENAAAGPRAHPRLLGTLWQHVEEERAGPALEAFLSDVGRGELSPYVCRILACLGPAAAPAVPALRAETERRVRVPVYLGDEDEEMREDERLAAAARETLRLIGP